MVLVPSREGEGQRAWLGSVGASHRLSALNPFQEGSRNQLGVEGKIVMVSDELVEGTLVHIGEFA